MIDRWRKQAADYLEPTWRGWHRALISGLGPMAAVLACGAVVFGIPTWLGWTGRVTTVEVIQLILAGTAATWLTSRRNGIKSVEEAGVCLAALDRLRDRVSAASTQSGKPGTGRIESSADGWIRLRDLRFGYPGGPAVLDGIDLKIAPGEVVAFVGVNGAGKTTLAKVLCGLYPPQDGTLSWPTTDGAPQRVGVIFQDFIRYPLTLAENVRLGADDHEDPAGILDAIRMAGADDLLERLPAGIDTVLSKVQPGGVDLSGGQWQKVALARAIFAVRHGRSILIMDEPTAHLDADLEAEFHDRVVRTLADTTMIMISHRLSTVRAADRIVLIDGGRIVEQGDHVSLMASDGHYARLFRLQASRFAEHAAVSSAAVADHDEVDG